MTPNILNNISSVIAKDLKVSLRSINVDTDSGMFSGQVKDNRQRYCPSRFTDCPAVSH